MDKENCCLFLEFLDLYRGKGTKKDTASVLLILVLLLTVFVVKIVFVLVIIGDVGGRNHRNDP